ncbi:MAG: pilus assembly PilX N-terminal domain-containing protein [Deltaproteobacteria bacterium]|nr:pilus assembly PilX N-terminal domain-containing protein [Deltaproteobacteria bacterium]
MRNFKKLLANERGVILVISLLIMVLLIGAGVGAMVSMQTDLRSSSNLKTGTQAFYIADAGINHARQRLQDSDSPNFDSIFTAANGTEIASNSSFHGGAYTVTRQGSLSNPSRIKVLSVGTGPNNAKSQIEVWFRKDAGRPPKAVVVNGDLRISSNPSILGTGGGAHSNDDMQITGNPGVQMVDGLTASNKPGGGGSLPEGMDISGSPCIGSSACSNPPGQQPEANLIDTSEEKDAYEAAHSGAPEQAIPRINPADYAPKVAAMGSSGNHYILHDDGTVTTGPGVTCGADGLCTGGTAVAVPAGWSFSGGTWSVSGNSTANGVFYSEGKVDVFGSPGSSSSPWQATIIARDDIRISGSLHIKPYLPTSDDLKNHLLVTGNDLEISGNIGADYAAGAILVHQQFRISSSPKINGFIIAGDGQPTWTGDPFPPSVFPSGVMINEISGNPIITYNSDFGCNGPGCPPPTVAMLTWLEVF